MGFCGWPRTHLTRLTCLGVLYIVLFSFNKIKIDFLRVPVGRRTLIWPGWRLKGPVSRRMLIVHLDALKDS